MSRISDLKGKKFGRLRPHTLVRVKGRIQWICDCDCGNTTTVDSYCIRNGFTKSCGCWQVDRLKMMTTRMKMPGIACANEKIRWYRGNAKRRGVAFPLTTAQFIAIASAPCAYCGVEAKITCKNRRKHNGHIALNGIDRRDSSRGYESDNIVPCCTTCNVAKMALSEEEFLAHVRRIAAFRGI